MDVRRAALAGTWYPAGAEECRSAIRRYLPHSTPDPELSCLGGLVPHAGWAYSGPTIASTLVATAASAPDTVVLFGFSHRVGIGCSQISRATAWETPLGPLPVARSVAELLIDGCPGLLEWGDDGHPPGENSIEVVTPYIRYLLPNASFLPIAVGPDSTAPELGRRIGASLAARDGRVAVLGSTDLTHYGSRHYGFAPHGGGAKAHRWSKEENDRTFLDRVLALDPEGAIRGARENRSACGAASAASALAAATAMGATTATLLEHTTSWEVMPGGREPTDFVGYASVVFARDKRESEGGKAVKQ